MPWRKGCEPWVTFASRRCHGWPISRSGPRHAKQPCGLPASSLALTRQTVEPPLRASWRQTPSPRACVQSWPTGPPGLGAPRTSCGCARRVLARVRLEALHGPKTRGRLPAGCGGRRPSCGPLGSRSHLLEKAGRGQESSGCAQQLKRRSVPSAPSASSVLPVVGLEAIKPSLLELENNDVVQTMLTVLTQTSAFVSGSLHWTLNSIIVRRIAM